MSGVAKGLADAKAAVVYGAAEVPWRSEVDGELVVSWSLPTGKRYGCVCTVQEWISVTKACPLVDVKAVDAKGARIGVLSQEGGQTVGKTITVCYIGYAY